MITVFKAATIIRKELLASGEWKFEGSFENYEHPRILTSFLKWIIAGPNTNIEAMSKNDTIAQSSINIAQIIHSTCKTTRQINYVSKTKQGGPFKKSKETPFQSDLELLSIRILVVKK